MQNTWVYDLMPFTLQCLKYYNEMEKKKRAFLNS